MTKREFTPLPEVMEHSERLDINVGSLALPVGLEPDTIGMDIRATERAAQLCDTSRLLILGASIDEDEVEIDGNMQADGSLVGAKAATRKATNYQSGTIGLGKEFSKSIGSAVVLNNGLRKSRAQETADLYSPTYQARMLDNQLRKGLKGIARENQIDLGLGPFSRVFLTLGDAGLAYWATEMVLTGELDTASSVRQLVLRGLVAGFYAHRANSFGLEAKPSALWSMHLDRYAMAAGYLATHRLIAPLQTS